ncbi:hypothetical protein EYF80_046533 [Liparis tanakae]|uniref:Uncharacterized protein n=1 Tax=Liparis tanakae TaxID=230148 RepID=A0A4Z2FR66_9TELE|nr:hypothetical protein EYF80_046533 [Liparis tanakae]
MLISTWGATLETVRVRVGVSGSLQLCRTGEAGGLLLLLLQLLQLVARLGFPSLHPARLLLAFSLYRRSSLSGRGRGPLGFRREKFPEPRPVQIVLEFHLEGRQPEQEGPDPARGAQVGGFLLVLRLHVLLPSPVASPGARAAEALGRLRGARSGSFDRRLIGAPVDRRQTGLRPLRAGPLGREAFAEVERQRLLGGGRDGGARRLGAQVLGQRLGQPAGEGLELRRAQASPHQLAHLDAAVQVERQDPEGGQRGPAPGVPHASPRGRLVRAAPRAVVVLRVGRVGLRLKLVPARMRRIGAPAFGLECVDGRVVLGGALRRQGGALRRPLEADAAPEDWRGRVERSAPGAAAAAAAHAPRSGFSSLGFARKGRKGADMGERRYPVRAAGRRSAGLPSAREQRTRRLGFGVLLRHQLGLSEQRGLVARARRPAAAPLRRHGDGRVRDLRGETEHEEQEQQEQQEEEKEKEEKEEQREEEEQQEEALLLSLLLLLLLSAAAAASSSSEVGDFVDGRAEALHEGEELIQEQLLFGVGEPAALTADLHAAHHVLLRGDGRYEERRWTVLKKPKTFQTLETEALMPSVRLMLRSHRPEDDRLPSEHSLNCQEKPAVSSVGWLKVSLQYSSRVSGRALTPPRASRWRSCSTGPLAPAWMRLCRERKRQYCG